MNSEFYIRSGNNDEQLIKDALAIRHLVFCQEQQIDQSLDVDGKDTHAHQVVVYEDAKPVATGRIVLEDAQIARIAVIKSHRHQGLSGKIMDELERIAKTHQLTSVKLTPHIELLSFYGKRGYEEVPNSRFSVAGHDLTLMRKSLV